MWGWAAYHRKSSIGDLSNRGMDELPEARPISDATVDVIVESANPAWQVEEATRAERGFCSVYRVAVSAGDREEILY